MADVIIPHSCALVRPNQRGPIGVQTGEFLLVLAAPAEVSEVLLVLREALQRRERSLGSLLRRRAAGGTASRKPGGLLLDRFSLGLFLLHALPEGVMPVAQGLDLVQRFLPCMHHLRPLAAESTPGTELGY